jgi:hypothetical protein
VLLDRGADVNSRNRKADSQFHGMTPLIMNATQKDDSIEKELDKAYDYKTCLRLGDLWVHLESLAGGVKPFATRNYKESQILCPILGLEMKLP